MANEKVWFSTGPRGNLGARRGEVNAARDQGRAIKPLGWAGTVLK